MCHRRPNPEGAELHRLLARLGLTHHAELLSNLSVSLSTLRNGATPAKMLREMGLSAIESTSLVAAAAGRLVSVGEDASSLRDDWLLLLHNVDPNLCRYASRLSRHFEAGALWSGALREVDLVAAGMSPPHARALSRWASSASWRTATRRPRRYPSLLGGLLGGLHSPVTTISAAHGSAAHGSAAHGVRWTPRSGARGEVQGSRSSTRTSSTKENTSATGNSGGRMGRRLQASDESRDHGGWNFLRDYESRARESGGAGGGSDGAVDDGADADDAGAATHASLEASHAGCSASSAAGTPLLGARRRSVASADARLASGRRLSASARHLSFAQLVDDLPPPQCAPTASAAAARARRRPQPSPPRWNTAGVASAFAGNRPLAATASPTSGTFSRPRDASRMGALRYEMERAAAGDPYPHPTPTLPPTYPHPTPTLHPPYTHPTPTLHPPYTHPTPILPRSCHPAPTLPPPCPHPAPTTPLPTLALPSPYPRPPPKPPRSEGERVL